MAGTEIEHGAIEAIRLLADGGGSKICPRMPAATKAPAFRANGGFDPGEHAAHDHRVMAFAANRHRHGGSIPPGDQELLAAGVPGKGGSVRAITAATAGTVHGVGIVLQKEVVAGASRR